MAAVVLLNIRRDEVLPPLYCLSLFGVFDDVE